MNQNRRDKTRINRDSIFEKIFERIMKRLPRIDKINILKIFSIIFRIKLEYEKFLDYQNDFLDFLSFEITDNNCKVLYYFR